VLGFQESQCNINFSKRFVSSVPLKMDHFVLYNIGIFDLLLRAFTNTNPRHRKDFKRNTRSNTNRKGSHSLLRETSSLSKLELEAKREVKGVPTVRRFRSIKRARTTVLLE